MLLHSMCVAVLNIYDDVHGGWLDRVFFGRLNVGVCLSCSQGFPSITPYLEHVCAGGGVG